VLGVKGLEFGFWVMRFYGSGFMMVYGLWLMV
jgi:hypothetical protein